MRVTRLKDNSPLTILSTIQSPRSIEFDNEYVHIAKERQLNKAVWEKTLFADPELYFLAYFNNFVCFKG